MYNTATYNQKLAIRFINNKVAGNPGTIFDFNRHASRAIHTTTNGKLTLQKSQS